MPVRTNISGGGSNIKSIQRGTIAINVATTTIDITVTSIDTTKSIAIISNNQDGVSNPSEACFAITIINATTIRITRTASSFTSITVSWQLIEYNNVKSKQTGTFEQTSALTDQSVTVTSVNTSKSILYATHTSVVTGIQTASWVFLYKLLNSTTIAFNGQNASTKYWQLIEFE